MATVIAWTDDYSVGIREIDEQHQLLVDLINKLYTAIAAKSSHAMVEEILEELIQYTRTHFFVEECLMRMFQYPHYDEHKATHDRIVERVLLFQMSYREGCYQSGMDLLYFLKDWLMEHINEEDKAYSPHVVRNKKPNWLHPFR